MDLFHLAASRVEELAASGFDLKPKCQVLLFSFLVESGDISEVHLTWSQLRSCFQYLQENNGGRLERVF